MSGQSGRIGRNVLFTLLTQLASWCLSIVVTLYLPGYIKDTGLGALTLAGSISGFLGVVVSLGTSTVLIKEIARDQSKLGSLILAGIAMRIPLSIAAAAITVVSVRLLHYSNSVSVIIYLAVLGMLIGQFSDVFSCALRALEDFRQLNAIALLEKFLGSGAIICLILAHASLVAIVCTGIVTGFITLALSGAVIAIHFMKKQISFRWGIDTGQIRFLVFAGVPFLTSAIFTGVYGQSDAILLSKMSGVAQIGWYGLANRLAGSTMIIPVTLCATMLPTMARLFHEDDARFAKVVQRLFNLMVVSVIPFAAILILAPRQILQVLHYPASFAHSIPVLILTGAGIIFWFLSQAASTTLIACDRQRVFAKITGVAALVSVPQCAACIWLAERWLSNGAIGAVASDVLLEAGMVSAYIACLPHGYFPRSVGSVFIRACVAALPMIILFLYMHGPSTLYLPALGLLLFVPLCFFMRCFHPGDVEMVLNIFRRQSRA